MSIFKDVPVKRPGKNAFNLSHDVKLSLKFGKLYPVLCEETVPGDIFKGKSQMLLRLAPMTAPVMHNINAYVHYFYVPNRILWDGWEDFITGRDEAIEPPYVTADSPDPQNPGPWVTNGSLLDYLGLPSAEVTAVEYGGTGDDLHEARHFNALPLAAYRRIWFDYYRDQNLEYDTADADDIKLSNGYNLISGGAAGGLAYIRHRNWLHDYFTSALPWAQKGPAAMIPLSQDVSWNTGRETKIRNRTTGDPVSGTTMASDGLGDFVMDGYKRAIDNSDALSVNDTGESSIENLRRAFRLQEWLERNARGGTRYIESILSHFGERVRDYRLERPEYIGGQKQRVQISEVLQTSETGEGGEPLATMAGHGISASHSGGYNYKCQEHGFIIGILSVMPNTAYYQGVPRKFGARKDRLDYFWPSFANLGEQAIENKELVYNGSSAMLDRMQEPFGYTPRYSEYRWGKSTVAGDYNTSLEFWHMARKFPTSPNLNASFMNVAYNENEEFDRIFAVRDGTDYLWAHINHDIKAIRPMPRYATPSI